MKNSVKKMTKFLLVLAFLSTGAIVSAQGSFSTGADIVSSYVWRGVPQDLTHPSGTPNIQPFASYTTGALTLGVWGSGSFTGTVKEFDIYATYALSSLFSVTVTDYNWTFGQSYFKYNKGTDHFFEGTLSYAGTESFPLSASVNTMFYGADKNASGDNSYSTYTELGYPLASNAKLFLGASLFDSPAVYGNKGFAVTNVGVKVSKVLKISDSFNLPVYGIAGFNPQAENAFFVAGITL